MPPGNLRISKDLQDLSSWLNSSISSWWIGFRQMAISTSKTCPACKLKRIVNIYTRAIEKHELFRQIVMIEKKIELTSTNHKLRIVIQPYPILDRADQVPEINLEKTCAPRGKFANTIRLYYQANCERFLKRKVLDYMFGPLRPSTLLF